MSITSYSAGLSRKNSQISYSDKYPREKSVSWTISGLDFLVGGMTMGIGAGGEPQEIRIKLTNNKGLYIGGKYRGWIRPNNKQM